MRSATGSVFEETVHWIVADGEITAVAAEDSVEPSEDYTDFIIEFHNWLEIDHPDVFAQMEWVPIYEPEYVSPNSVALALEWVDEYVATRSGS